MSGELVPLFPGQGANEDERPVRSGPPPPSFCRHMRTELDSEARRVYCRDCTREVPAFDALKNLAQSHERFIDQRKEADRLARLARVELEEAKRLERNAKARARKAVGAAPECSCVEAERVKLVRYSPGPWCSVCGGRRG